MRKILLQLDADSQPSVFDAITAADAADCVLLRHGGVTAENAPALVHGCMFTRSPQDLANTAIFIGGSNIEAAEEILRAVSGTLWEPLNVSVMFDPGGCNTTAAAAVYFIASAIGAEGRKIAVVSGTGPVGQRAAGLASKLGARVVITSRSLEKAELAADAIEERFGSRPECAVVRAADDLPPVLDDAAAVLCCGAAGVELIPEQIWREHPTIKVAADVNAVPPFGLAGAKTQWRGENIGGKLIYGAIGIGWLKMKLHRLALTRLFESVGTVLDAEGVYALASEAAGAR